MCTRTRIFVVCPCRNAGCVDFGNVCNGLGHIVEVDTHSRTVWDYCDWWFAHGPPELVLNSSVTPRCKNLGWDDLKTKLPEICDKCKRECQETRLG
ncbi:hypothetical protein HDV57DRAFT_513063 [Trichoderma longibrachiatum]